MAEQLDPNLLEELMRKHGAALELFAGQWTTMPEDCVQEAFLQLVREPKTPDRPLAWLYRVVRNRAISWRRSATRAPPARVDGGCPTVSLVLIPSLVVTGTGGSDRRFARGGR